MQPIYTNPLNFPDFTITMPIESKTNYSEKYIFRAIDFDNKIIHDVLPHSDKVIYRFNEVTGTDQCSMVLDDVKVINQWTGLYDKNGVKIFEGDIVECKLISDGTKILEVVRFEYGVTTPFYLESWAECYREYKVKVIGDIYNNRKLLN